VARPETYKHIGSQQPFPLKRSSEVTIRAKQAPAAVAEPFLEQLSELHIRGTVRFWFTQPLSFWFIGLYLMFEYVRPQSIYTSIDVLPWTQVLVIGAAGALLVRGQKIGLPTIGGAALLLFTVIVFASTASAFSVTYAQLHLSEYYNWVIIIFLIVNIVRTESMFLTFMFLFLLASFKMSQHGARVWGNVGFGYASSGVSGAPGFFQNSGEVGIQMCVFLPLSLAFIWALWEKWPRWKLAVMALMPITAMMTIIASSSRGAIVGIGAVGAWWLFFVNRKHRARAFVVTLLVGLTVFAFIPQEQRDRLGSSGEDYTSTHRLELWGKGVEMANEHPLLGVGFANWTPYYVNVYGAPTLFGESILPHNVFVQCLAELGYLGLIGFLLMIGATFRLNSRTRRLTRRMQGGSRFILAMAYGLDGALVGFMASGFFVTVLYYPYFWINLAMTISLHMAAREKLRGQRAAPTRALRAPHPVAAPRFRRGVARV